MKLCRFRLNQDPEPRIGLIGPSSPDIVDLTAAGVESLTALLEEESLSEKLTTFLETDSARHTPETVTLLAPVEHQEVWAAGVTYQRSKKARMEESDFSANAYDLVYDAERPEIFFKSVPEKVVGPGGDVGIRKDATWNVPEPELVLVYNSNGRLVAYSIGNDMSSRDIEGENLLYLPQAKVYDKSCAVGPWLVVGPDENEARQWGVTLQIGRDGALAFKGETAIGQLKRRFEELTDFMHRSQTFPNGSMLLTGTGVVPGDDFTLQQGDVVRITISGIGTLENQVALV